ncbi:diguanylate cyclase [Pigmentiphaga aceris]|uniref:diguanylate cyclase n=1 Tax=Pigmentiphaga aceris TaxID=1940612 RepID=A0A5C0AT76_9BURK|nr:GGDEF domain-containing protein [Pigmentiphaga aceris]QEI04836.1 diguanylate cyclase [Pigmentiphaga aceris]
MSTHPESVAAPASAPADAPSLWGRLKHFLWWGLLLVMVVLMGLALLALRHQSDELTGPQRYNDVWYMHRTATELERLNLAITAVRNGVDVERDTLSLPLERMLSAVEVVDRAPQHATVVIGEMPQLVLQLGALASEVRGWLAQAGTADPIARIAIAEDVQARIPAWREVLQNGAIDVQFNLSQRIDGDRRGLFSALTVVTWALGALMLCTAALLAHLLWSRRRAQQVSRVLSELNRTLEQRIDERTLELGERRALLDFILEASPSDVALSDAATGRLHFANHRLLERLGLPADVEFLPVEHLLADPLQGSELVAELDRHGRIEGHEARMAGIPPYFGLVSARKLAVGGVPAYLMWSFDISERIALESRLRELASTDVLSGLLNRRAFLQQCASASAQCLRHSRPYAMLMIDIDYFKRINDTYGHHVGDEVIRAVGELMHEHARESDISGRMGGEEFAVMLPETSLEDAMRVARRLHSAVNELRLELSEAKELRFTSSIGVADASLDERSVETLLQRADSALYQAKRNGRNRIEAVPIQTQDAAS